MIKICSICMVLLIGSFIGCSKMKYTSEVETAQTEINEMPQSEMAQYAAND